MDEIRAIAGPIIQRYLDKLEEERQAAKTKLDAELAAKRAAEEENKKTEEEKKAQEAGDKGSKDEEMTDADASSDLKVEEVE